MLNFNFHLLNVNQPLTFEKLIMKVGAYVQPYDFFPIIKTLALHGAKFIPDVETHSIHPTVKSLD